MQRVGASSAWSVFIAIPTLGWLLGLMACSEAQPKGKEIPPVRVAEVVTIQSGNPVKYSANIVPNAQVDLNFKSGGYVESIREVRGTDGRTRKIDEGDWVTRNTVLAVVRQQDYQDKLQEAKAQLARSQADYEHAKLQFDRTSALYNAQSATKPEYDSAKAQFDSATAAVSGAQANLSQAQLALNDSSLKAPFDSWIVKRSVDIGSLVGMTTTGFTVADTSSVKAVFGVPDVSMGLIRLGQRQSITTDALPGNFDGRVTAISPAADPKSRVYSVEVTIPNPGDRLKSGMIAALAVGGPSLPRPVTAAPLASIIRDPNRSNGFAVLVVDGTGDTATVHLRAVDPGDAYGNLVAINGGVSKGERVVTSGATIVKDGDQVRIIP